MALSLTKEQREQAKREQKAMIQIHIDARFIPKDECDRVGIFDGTFGLSGPMTPERARELFAMCSRWMQENKANRKEEAAND